MPAQASAHIMYSTTFLMMYTILALIPLFLGDWKVTWNELLVVQHPTSSCHGVKQGIYSYSLLCPNFQGTQFSRILMDFSFSELDSWINSYHRGVALPI